MESFELVLIGESDAFIRMFSYLIKSIRRRITLIQCRVNAGSDIDFLAKRSNGIFIAEDSRHVRNILVRCRLLEDRKVIVISGKPDLGTLKYYLKAGAVGLSSLETAVGDFEYILKSVAFRNIYICPQYTGLLFSFLRSTKVEVSISEREMQVLQLLYKGFTYFEISTDLNLSRETVKKHVSNLYNKLDVSSKRQAINKALKMRILADADVDAGVLTASH